MSEPFLGELRLFGFSFNPSGWAKCDGQLLQVSQNTALFSLLGTQYGGNGENTFGLPDLRGRANIHQGTGPGLPNYTIGSRAGNFQTTLIVNNLPAHDHPANLKAAAADADQVIPLATALATAREDTYSATAPTVNMAADSVSVGTTGGGTSFTNMQPYLVLNWCIALQGIFPSEN